jgi:glycosyltransferase involved in cell wall biosynthesis
VPIVGTHSGGAPYIYSPFSFINHLPFSFIEKNALKRMDKLLAPSSSIYDFYSKFCHDVVVCYSFGVDFQEFKPFGKEEARSALGIPLNKKVLLHIGRFDLTKGLDTILKVYQRLRHIYDLELLLVGGLKTDPLYHEALKSGASVREWVSQPELVPYYNAADIYLFPKFYTKKEDEKLEEFMGIGVAPLESLACGTPVIGTNLKHFLGTEEELRGVGRIPTDPEDVAQCVSEVLEHPDLYRNCREIAWKYYSWDNIVAQTVNIYDELFEKYYK